MEVRLKRVYDPESPGDGFRVLVDKLWPRGIRKEAFHYDLWAKRIAPSTSLRVWYHGDPAGRWAEFRRKYLDELGSSAAMQDFLDRIRTYPDVTSSPHATSSAARDGRFCGISCPKNTITGCLTTAD